MVMHLSHWPQIKAEKLEKIIILRAHLSAQMAVLCVLLPKRCKHIKVYKTLLIRSVSIAIKLSGLLMNNNQKTISKAKTFKIKMDLSVH